MQEEVDQKTIALAVKTGKLTAQVLQAAIRKYLAARQKGTGKTRHGQQSLHEPQFKLLAIPSILLRAFTINARKEGLSTLFLLEAVQTVPPCLSGFISTTSRLT